MKLTSDVSLRTMVKKIVSQSIDTRTTENTEETSFSQRTEIMSVSMVKNRFAFSCRIIVMPLYFKDITVSPTGAKVNGIGGSVIVTLGVL